MDFGRKRERKEESLWTLCPYCCYMYEYDGLFEDCVLRCQNQNCERAFHGVSMPPPSAAMLVQGKDQYYLSSLWTLHVGMGVRTNPSPKKDDQGAAAAAHVHVMEISSSSSSSDDDSFSTVGEEKGKKQENGEKDIKEEMNGGVGLRRRKVKCVARNIKKVTGRGEETRRLLRGKLSGAGASSSARASAGARMNIGSGSHEDGSSSSGSFSKGMGFM